MASIEPISRQERILVDILHAIEKGGVGGGSATNGQVVFDISQLTTTRANVIEKIDVVSYTPQ